MSTTTPLPIPGSPACARPRRWGGAVIGGAVPAVAVATTGASVEHCAAQARDAARAGADVVELRLDLLDAAALLDSAAPADPLRRAGEGAGPRPAPGRAAGPGADPAVRPDPNPAAGPGPRPASGQPRRPSAAGAPAPTARPKTTAPMPVTGAVQAPVPMPVPPARRPVPPPAPEPAPAPLLRPAPGPGPIPGEGDAVPADAASLEPRALHRLAALFAHAAVEAAEALADRQIPMLLTLRTAAEGGALALGAEDYTTILDLLVRHLPEATRPAAISALDVEFSSGALPALARHAHDSGLDVVASSHDCTTTPSCEEMSSRLERMETAGADIAKIAVTPACPADVVGLLAATARARSQLAIPVVAMSMGEVGVLSRMLAGVFGSALTFATAGGRASAPGQPPVAEVRQALAALTVPTARQAPPSDPLP